MIYYTLFDDAANTSILEIVRNNSKTWATASDYPDNLKQYLDKHDN